MLFLKEAKRSAKCVTQVLLIRLEKISPRFPKKTMKFFLKSIAIATCLHLRFTLATDPCTLPDARPALINRTFTSPVIDAAISALRPRFLDPNLGTLFSNTLPNSLDTTILHHSNESFMEDSFVITGDIPAMWLRDSTNQFWPYLRFVGNDTGLQQLFIGLIRRQTANVLRQPYANAFQINGSEYGPHRDDYVFPIGSNTNWTFEMKWEADSLSNTLRLASAYYNATKDTSPFDDTWYASVLLIIQVFKDQQRGSVEEDDIYGIKYAFQRNTAEPSDSLEHGRGAPANSGTGLIKCGFRGSDDALLLPFNIPENAFAASALTSIASLLRTLNYIDTADDAEALSNQIRTGIYNFGIISNHSVTGKAVFAYEVDGYGNQIFMDDANIPGLLSMPYYDFVDVNDPLYLNTRAAIMSNRSNPYWISGKAGSGVGGPHNGAPWVWPMSITTRAYTSTSDDEISDQLQLLVNSSACTGFIHESFNKSNVMNYTRPWFAWANSQFADLVLKLAEERPHLIFKS